MIVLKKTHNKLLEEKRHKIESLEKEIESLKKANTHLIDTINSLSTESERLRNSIIALASSGVVRNPETGDQCVMLRTRYALHEFTNIATSLDNSSTFYKKPSQ